MEGKGSPPSPMRPSITVETAGDTTILNVEERFGAGSSRAAAGGGGGGCASPTGLPSIDGLEICCIGAGYVGGPTMAMIAKSACRLSPFPIYLSRG